MKDEDSGCIGMAFFTLFVLAVLFLLPAVLVIWPFSKDFMTACQTATCSILAWLWSAACWGVLCLLIYSLKK